MEALLIYFFLLFSGNPADLATQLDQFNLLFEQELEGDDLTLQAYTAYRSKNYEEAINILKSKDELSSEQKFLLAYTHFVGKDYDQAGKIFQSIRREGTTNAYVSEANFYRVLCLLAAGNKDEALKLKATFDKSSWESKELSDINI